MKDPIPPPPPFLRKLTIPIAEALHFYTLPDHIHEVLFALFFYQSIQSFVSPVLSNLLFPKIYQKLTYRTRVNWDVHVVSLVQSVFINVFALWLMLSDGERWDMKNSAVERIYGYTGASGLLQALAAGYFIWDLIVSTRYIKIFGPGIWAHAITALMVYSFGFVCVLEYALGIMLANSRLQRPFANYYGPVFILYELSSPFLNIHWFCDKLNMTGSKLQWYNGMLLLGSFFGCRLIWGVYQSFRVFHDVWQILHIDSDAVWRQGQNVTNPSAVLFAPRDGQLCLGDVSCIADQAEVMKFVNQKISVVPFWLCIVYLVSNFTLNLLNFYWFGKMVETVRKRFQGKPHDEFKHERDRRQSIIEEAATRLDREVLTGPETPATEKDEPSFASKSLATGAFVDRKATKRK